jgi:hypothetical protein
MKGGIPVPDQLCARCRQPAPYTDRDDGKPYCGDCLFLPGPLYGPGYEWLGNPYRSDLGASSRCENIGPQPWQHYCTIQAGHSGLHEGWGGDRRDPASAWDSEGRCWYVNPVDYASWPSRGWRDPVEHDYSREDNRGQYW